MIKYSKKINDNNNLNMEGVIKLMGVSKKNLQQLNKTIHIFIFSINFSYL
jgi:ABC-type enterochelin transport system ATPase subunit